MRKCTCPNCNAALEFSEDREFGFCEFCGTKVVLDDVRILSRHEDVAEVKRIELERELKLRELDEQREEKERKRIRVEKATETRNKFLKVWNVLWIGALVVLIPIWGLATLFGHGESLKETICAILCICPIISISVIVINEADKDLLEK